MRRILVTGGAGFIGSNLCEHFLQENEVVCLDNLSTGFVKNIEKFLDHDRFIFIEGDIVDFDTCERAVKGVDIVYHQAALGSVSRSIENPRATNQCNVEGFLNMIEASRLAEVGRFIYATSSSTYGDSEKLPKVEEEIGQPLSPYAVTKRVNELYAGVYSNLYGMETIGLRYFNVFGPNQNPDGVYAAVIPKFIDRLANGDSITIHGDGSQTRDFTYIDNVIHANDLAGKISDARALNQIYNIAFGGKITLNELVDQITLCMTDYGLDANKINVQHGEKRPGDVYSSFASIEKAKDLMGYQPQLSLSEGLKRYMKHLVESEEIKIV